MGSKTLTETDLTEAFKMSKKGEVKEGGGRPRQERGHHPEQQDSPARCPRPLLGDTDYRRPFQGYNVSPAFFW